MLATVRAPRRLDGEVRLPGDKSISHRALMLNAVADGQARVRGLSPGADVASTAGCLRALGVEIEGGHVVGRGRAALQQAAHFVVHLLLNLGVLAEQIPGPRKGRADRLVPGGSASTTRISCPTAKCRHTSG